MWWHVYNLLDLGRLRQRDHKFEVILGYITRPYLRNKLYIYSFGFVDIIFIGCNMYNGQLRVIGIFISSINFYLSCFEKNHVFAGYSYPTVPQNNRIIRTVQT